MGKRKKRKDTAVTEKVGLDPIEEQNRLRSAVLKVFRARVSSPGGGPAIILPTEQPEKSIGDLQLLPDRESSEDEMIIVDHLCTSRQETSKKASQKEKKRKSRGDRNKEKDERNKEKEERNKEKEERNKEKDVRYKKHTPVNCRARAEFRKHVKRADEIVSKSKLGRQRALQSYSSITQNRLTRKLGLYNQGKKSDRIIREHLPVRDSVLKRTEKDLRKILDKSNNGIECPSTPQSAPSSEHPLNVYDDNMNNTYYSCQSSISHSSEKWSNENSETVKNQLEECSSLKEPDLNNVAEELCNSIDLSVFPGRDLFLEIQTELMKTLAINSRMTPSKLTPAIKQQPRNSQSARRNLHTLLSSAEQLPHHSDVQESHSEVCTGGEITTNFDPTKSMTSIFHTRSRRKDDFSKLEYTKYDDASNLQCTKFRIRENTRNVPCTQSRPDDEPAFSLFHEDNGNYNSHGNRNEIQTTSHFTTATTLLDFAESSHHQGHDRETDYGLSAMNMIRKNEQSLLQAHDAVSTQMPYGSSLDFLDELDKGLLHSTVPHSQFDPHHQHHSETTAILFSPEEFNLTNPNLMTNTEDLFYEPALFSEISPMKGSVYPKVKGHHKVKGNHKRRCWHVESDSDDSPVLCYKCLDPIKPPNVDGYSPKFHPQKMY